MFTDFIVRTFLRDIQVKWSLWWQADWTQLEGMISEKGHGMIHVQDKEETYIRNSQEEIRAMYGGSGKCIMQIMSYEADI